MLFCGLTYFSKSTFRKKKNRITIRMSNSLDADWPQHFVGPDLGSIVCKGYQQTTVVGQEFK